MDKITLSNGRKALIRFENYATAKEVGETFLFSKRDGHGWKEVGAKYEPLTAWDYLEDLGDNYSIENQTETEAEIHCNGELAETVLKEMMSYSEDVTIWAIGVYEN